MSDTDVEELRRKTRLSQQIEELERAAASDLSVYLLSRAQFGVLIDQLRELRARRIAMGRAPDDEVNAAADMCYCYTWHGGKLSRSDGGECPLHPAHDDDDEIDWGAGPPVRPEPYPPPIKRRQWSHREFAEAEGVAPSELDLPILPDGPGEHGEPAWARGAAMPGDLDCDGVPTEAECRYIGGGECEPYTCPVAMGGSGRAGRHGPLLRCGLYRAALCPVAATDGHVDCLACEPLSEEP